MNKEPQFIYFRQSNGLAYQCSYDANITISQILHQILEADVPKYLKPICKGKLLQIDSSLSANNVKPNQIIHLLALSRTFEQKGFIYLSYQNKIHRIEFNVQQYVSGLKKKISLETGLVEDLQLILFNSIRLEDEKKIKEYEIRSGDFLCMAKNIQIKPIVFDMPQVIFPKKHSIQKRRGSQCMRKHDLINSEHPKTSNHQQVQYQQQIKMHEVSASNMMSPSLLYGPSPLSQCEFNSFKTSMENWIKKPQQVPEESFGEANSWLQKDKLNQQKYKIYDFPKITQQQSYKIQVKTPSFNQEIVLCQSLNYEDENLQKIQGLSQSEQNLGNKIISKFTVSTNLNEDINNESEHKPINSSRINLKNLKTKRFFTITELINHSQQNHYGKVNKEFQGIRTIQQLKNLLYELQLKNVNEDDLQFFEYQEQDNKNMRSLLDREVELILKQIHTNQDNIENRQSNGSYLVDNQSRQRHQKVIGYHFKPKIKQASQIEE